MRTIKDDEGYIYSKLEKVQWYYLRTTSFLQSCDLSKLLTKGPFFIEGRFWKNFWFPSFIIEVYSINFDYYYGSVG